MKKRLLSILLCLVMALSLLPTSAFAATSYTVTFNANGGSGTMPKEQVLPSFDEFGNSSSIYYFPGCDFTAPSGYMFDKWEVVGNGAQYETGTEVGLFCNITVKPLWVEAPIVPTPTNPCWNGTTASWGNVDSSVTYIAVLHKDGDTSEIASKFVKGEGFADFADAINQNGEGNYYFEVSGYMRLNDMVFYSETATSASKRFPILPVRNRHISPRIKEPGQSALALIMSAIHFTFIRGMSRHQSRCPILIVRAQFGCCL